MPINGASYDHESLVMEIPGVGQALTLTEVSYTPKKDVDVKTDKNGVPHRIVRKAFEGNFSCTVARSEFNSLLEGTSDTGVLGAEPMAITLTYGDDGEEPVEDELEVKITDTELGSKEDDEAMVKITGKQTSIPKLSGHEAYVVPGGGGQ